MWLFSQRGFYSIVQHKDHPDTFVVKARIKGDIEKYWPDAVIERNEAYDYLYRTSLPRDKVIPVITKIVSDINYSSYKGTLEDSERRREHYVNVWDILVNMQEHLMEDENGNKGTA
jgi:hypothetical protein